MNESETGTAVTLTAGATQLRVVACAPLDAPAEAIVISANNWLDAGSGEALEVRQRTGPAYDVACRRVASAAPPGGLTPGTAVTMLGHALTPNGPPKVIVQAITIRYPQRGSAHGRVKATPNIVYRAASAALYEANRHNAHTVAVYLMTLRNGYCTRPAHVMADAMCRALVDHAAAGSPIRQVLVCETDPDRLLLAAQALRHAHARLR